MGAKKKITLFLILISLTSSVFAQANSEYQKYLSKAKEYESQKRWIYALDAYYDAMGTDELPKNKQEAYDGYKKLADAIESGNPGLGKFDKFSLHDEWKNLLIDAEKYGSSICIYDITIGNLKEESLDYKSKTATYSAWIDYELGDRYKKTIAVVENGFNAAYKDYWDDLPENWPKDSITAMETTWSEFPNGASENNIDGALIHREFFRHQGEDMSSYSNAFMEEDNYYCKFNIVDEKGKELVKGKLFHLERDISFSGINSDVMNLIDDKKAFLNLVDCYIEYGIYDCWTDSNQYTKLSKAKVNREKVSCISENDSKSGKISKNVFFLIIENMMADIDGMTIRMLKTEVTQSLYEAVMEYNPSHHKGENLPVECVSLYDAIYFCNKLSKMTGLTTVYSVNGNTDVNLWNYSPHKGNSITVSIKVNESANGFRLPSIEEWSYAAKGGSDYKYAGSSNYEDVA